MENLLQLYEINDDPKRKEFLDDLFSFMQKRGKLVAFFANLVYAYTGVPPNWEFFFPAFSRNLILKQNCHGRLQPTRIGAILSALQHIWCTGCSCQFTYFKWIGTILIDLLNLSRDLQSKCIRDIGNFFKFLTIRVQRRKVISTIVFTNK